jgi:hypothetical protein
MMYRYLKDKKLIFILFLILSAQLGINPLSLFSTESAQARSKSSGNEAKREIQSGLDLTGRTKTEVIKLIGPPWTKDTTPVKARYNEKWTYSCEDKHGATYNCVFIYFVTDRVKNVELF